MAKKKRGGAKGRITSRPYGKLQVVESKRKIFGKERQALFFEALAGSCNVRGSARAAGVSWQCVYQRRDRDPEFRARLRAAVIDAYEALEWRMLEETGGADEDEARTSDPHPARAERESPSPASGRGKLDKDLALALLREHKKGIAGVRDGDAPALRSAEWSEVEAYFIARLRALKVRIDSSPSGGGGAKRRRGCGSHDRSPPPSSGRSPSPRQAGGGFE